MHRCHGQALLRGGAGVFRAWVLACVSSLCLPELARKASASLGGWMYTGVGLGIALTGVLAWLGGNQSALLPWIELVALAALGTAYAPRSLAARPASSAFVGTSTSAHHRAELHPQRGDWKLVLCYSAFGFGYIIPATYLPTMARQLVSDPLVFGLTWPVFGTAAALSVAFVSRWLSAWSHRKVWAASQGVLVFGTLLALFQHGLWTLTASAVLVGGTFMVATMAGLQMAREQTPSDPTPLLARMTAGFATGQIAGPLFVWLLGDARFEGWDALFWANAAAILLLAVSALWLWRDGGQVGRVP